MTDATQNEYRPASVSPPGFTIADLLEERGIKQVELAARMGVTPKFINELVAGKASISPTTAIALERTLDLPADFWLTRDARYQEYRARGDSESELEGQVAWLDELPMAFLRKMGVIRQSRANAAVVAECLAFFAVASVEAWREQYVRRTLGSAAYRASTKLKASQGAVATWLRVGELEAAKVQCEAFARDRFLEMLPLAKALSREADPKVFIPELERIFAEAGVVVKLIPAPTGCPVSGAVRWLTPEKALIQLSLRYKSNDVLWFTLFHECGHLVLHGKKMLFLEESGLDGEEEEQANRFAADFLIPRDQWITIRDMLPLESNIRQIAERLGIAPGIVVGRLQKEESVPWRSTLNRLKVRYRWQ